MDTRRYDSLIVGLGEFNDPQRLDLHTKRKWSIPNARPIFPRAPESTRAALELHQKAHPHAEIRNSDHAYNCVGLVFASRRTVIDIAHVRKILDDDGYHRIEITEAVHGDLILYEDQHGKPCHIGILWRADSKLRTYWVLSKWGEDGEYFHLIDQVPPQFRGGTQTIWTERMN